MPFVEAKCTNCGAILPVDSARDAWVCGYCGTPFVVEKAIQQFNITNNINTPMVNVFGGDTADVLYNRVLEWLALQNEAKAIQVLGEMTEKYPGDVRGWSRLAVLQPENGEYVNNAINLGDEELKEKNRQEAITICNDIRSGQAEKWITDARYRWQGYPVFHDTIYNSLPCVKALQTEGEENARALNDWVKKCREKYPNYQKHGYILKALDTLLGFPASYGMNIIIGNVACYIEHDESSRYYRSVVGKRVVTMAVLQSSFREIEGRVQDKNRVCLCCGQRFVWERVNTKDVKFKHLRCPDCDFWVPGDFFKK